jgi:hypothetical protein
MAGKLITMADTASTNPAPVDRPVGAYAGYVDGEFQSFTELVHNHWPGHHVFSICVNSAGRAECLDIETGDAIPQDAAPWVARMRAAGVYRPCIYANSSTMPAVIANLRGVPRENYRLWIAAYPGTGENVPAGYDAHQYFGTISGSWDYSVCNPDFFKPHPVKKKPVRRPTDIHPKVAAATIAGAITTAVEAVLHSHGVGVHLSPAEAGAITTAAAAIAGYVKHGD